MTGRTPSPKRPDEAAEPTQDSAGAAPELTLLEVRDGLPDVTDSPDGLADVARRFASGSGPVALDAERASGYRYSQRAYLVQLRRAGAGSALIDPVPFEDLAPLAEAIAGAEWILHAASQDLACLAELGLRPDRLFDTELAGRLLGLPRVGLATMVAELLGYELRKEHSAADWSTRPLPRPWLVYAALDVEVLIELRDVIEERLRAAGKWEWALQEFEAARTHEPRSASPDPWMRTSGVHRVHKRRQLAVVRELWQTRDRMAEESDMAPGRLLNDAAIVSAAMDAPADRQAMADLPAFRGRAQRNMRTWWTAVQHARELPDSALPVPRPRGDGPPPPRSWRQRHPEAADRLARVRTALGEVADAHDLPLENLLAPDAVRRLCWEPPDPDAGVVEARLTEFGARPWQVALTVDVVVSALPDPPADA